MGSLSPMHWIIVLAVIVLLFGATKLPQLARSVGQSARIFQAETRGLKEDEQAAGQQSAQQSQLTGGEQNGSTAQNQVGQNQAGTNQHKQADGQK